MHFVVKSDLLIELEGGYRRKVKVEWRGPSSSREENMEEMRFMVIDY